MQRDREWTREHLIGNSSDSSVKEAGGDSSVSVNVGNSSLIHYHFEKSGDHLKAMRSLSLCDGLVIGQSTFGWWAAYISNSSDVIAPKNMFAEKGPRFLVDDYFLPWWTLLSSVPEEDRIVGFT